jgi:hypothetical protein
VSQYMRVTYLHKIPYTIVLIIFHLYRSIVQNTSGMNRELRGLDKVLKNLSDLNNLKSCVLISRTHLELEIEKNFLAMELYTIQYSSLKLNL